VFGCEQDGPNSVSDLISKAQRTIEHARSLKARTDTLLSPRSDKAGFTFLITDLDLAMTLTRIASHARKDSEKGLAIRQMRAKLTIQFRESVIALSLAMMSGMRRTTDWPSSGRPWKNWAKLFLTFKGEDITWHQVTVSRLCGLASSQSLGANSRDSAAESAFGGAHLRAKFELLTGN